MNEPVDLIGLLVFLLIVACVVLFILTRLRLPPVIGYLVSGVLLGPHVLGSLDRSDTIATLAEIGVLLLMFTLGLEFDTRYFLRIRRVALGAGLTQILLTLLVALLAGLALGWTVRSSLFMGCVIALSSTAVTLKTLMQQGRLDTVPGRVTVAILILQDLAIVPMMILLPIGGSTPLEIGTEVLSAVARAVILLVLTFVLSRYLMPRFMNLMASSRSQELLLLVTLSVCLGMAWFSHLLGVSYALGAFLAGLILGGSEYAHQTTAQVIPFRDVFMGLFFVAMGMLLDPRYVVEHWPAVLLFVGIILIGKTIIAAAAITGFGFAPRISLQVGLNLAQVGEFSFLLALMGLRENLINEADYKLAIAASVLSMIVAPILIQFSPRLASLGAEVISGLLPALERMSGPASSRDLGAGPEEPVLSKHVVIIGYGTVGRALGEVLRANQVPFCALELDPSTVREYRHRGHPVIYGDAGSEELLKIVNLQRARFLALTLPDAVMERSVIKRARAMNPNLFIIARGRRESRDEAFYLDGADEVIHETFETGIEFIARILRRLNVPKQQVERQVARARGHRYEIFRRTDFTPMPLGDVRRTLDTLRAEFLEIPAESPLVGRSLRDAGIRELTGALVVAVIRDGKTIHSPEASFVLAGGDTILVTGAVEQVAQVEGIITDGAPPVQAPRG
ncbi:MAG: cation:proton antiporter [Acidobacteria bacterium]|nr:cation:proton antiporter [Acidobacteriota bacterium]